MRTVQFAAILDGVSKKKDSTLSVKLGTQELGPEDTARIFEFGNREVWVCLAETAVTAEDLEVPEVLTEFRKDKTPSERLRNVLYRLWEKEVKKTGREFDSWYLGYMDRAIEKIKEKLD